MEIYELITSYNNAEFCNSQLNEPIPTTGCYHVHRYCQVYKVDGRRFLMLLPITNGEVEDAELYHKFPVIVNWQQLLEGDI